MASHLTVTTSTAGTSTTRSFGSSGKDASSDDVFAALLGATDTPEPTPSRPSDNDVNMSTGFKPDQDDDLEAIAAAVDAQVELAPADVAQPKLAELIDGLADLKARLAAGEPLDADELARINSLLADLAQHLDIDLTDMPTADELAALMAGSDAAGDSLAGKLAAAFGPLVGDLLGHTDPSATAELSAQIKAVGDKLAAILNALNQGEMSADQLAELEKTLATDADFKAAMERALKPAVTVETAPALATPQLKLTEPVLTGKGDATASIEADDSSEAAKPADAPVAVKPSGKDSEKPGDKEQRSDDRKVADTKPNGAAAAPSDKQPDPQTAAQLTQAARVDITAAPRVVQTGYQTSQQQLNLPQLAFEMARQVVDGNTRFQIRLDPAELGKIDVRLDIDASGQVNARLTVEKAETLDLMQRDQKGLERALQQAGLDGSKTNLEFSLKQNPFGGQQGQDGNDRRALFGGDAADADDTPLPTVSLYRGNLSASGVNIIA